MELVICLYACENQKWRRKSDIYVHLLKLRFVFSIEF